MKHGIFYAYWKQEWNADYKYYIEKVAKLGFDILEIGIAPLLNYSDQQLAELKQCASDNNIILTANGGPSADQNLASPDASIRANAKAFYTDILKRLYKLDIHSIGGPLYSYWPVDYTQPIDKKRDWEQSVKGLREIAKVAEDCGVNFCLEVLNRFETYLINTAAEAVDFVKQVDHPSVKIHLDTFHMNIEEDSIGGAIRTAGSYLGHLHTGECNRNLPGKGRIPWNEVRDALHDINYNGAVVMEPFVQMGGSVGADIKVWHDISNGADENKLDKDAYDALNFSRYLLD